MSSNIPLDDATGQNWVYYGELGFDLGQSSFVSRAWDIAAYNRLRVSVSSISGAPSECSTSVEYSLDGGSWQASGTTIVFGGLSDGMQITAQLTVPAIRFARLRVTTPESAEMLCSVSAFAYRNNATG